MSGISELTRKAKMSIDEMYEPQSVGKMGIQKNREPVNKQSNKPAMRKENQPANKPTKQKAIPPTLPTTNQIIDPTLEQEPQLASKKAPLAPFNRVMQQPSIKMSTYKMTFNLTEDTYKAFNDLYATRMLQGRKTEKSEMICEAIQWLIKMEGSDVL